MVDLIVIGAGAVGSATAYHAAKAGYSVVLLEQYAIDHQRGSSYGYSRIIRYAYDHPVYIELMKVAYPAWRALEDEACETLYLRTGGIDFAYPGEPLFAAMVDCLTQANVPHEVLSTTDARQRFPQFRFDDDMRVLYQADAGVLRASLAVRTHIRLARRYGADVRENTPVLGIQPVAGGVEVRTAHETLTAAKLVVTAGGWMRPLLRPLGLDLPLQPLAAQENYLSAHDAAQFTPERFPVWIGHVQAEYGSVLYGLPSVDGSGVKIGLHTGPAMDPESPDRTPDNRLAEKMLDFARRYMPEAAGSVASSRVCIYTLTPDEHFIIDHHPQHPQIILASCCSGHGFKFSTLLGSILSDLAFKGATPHDLSLFSLSRFEGVST